MVFYWIGRNIATRSSRLGKIRVIHIALEVIVTHADADYSLA